MNKVLFIIFIHIQFHGVAQVTIYGSVRDSTESIPVATVVLKESTSGAIVAYTYSDNDGNFRLKSNKYGKLELSVTSLGYEASTFQLNLSSDQKQLPFDVLLQEKTIDLEEVTIRAKKLVPIQKDTIAFRTEFYKDGNEETVEDLLNKIPGLQVDSEGTIRIGNQEIEKLMVDGDDLFERGYKILSKNMPAYPIDEVEILKNFSNNKLLKNIEETDNVAVNLKLNEKYKHIWFGNIDAGGGNNNFYHLKGNVMNFGKKNKYYFFTNLNNTGFDATGDIAHLIRPMNSDEHASIGDNQMASTLLRLNANQLNFKKSRTHFNHAELLSLNAIFNPSNRLKIKTLGFFKWDEIDFFQNATNNVGFNETNFTNIENYKLRNDRRIAFGKVDLSYNHSKSELLEVSTIYNNGDYYDGSNLIFNENSTTENLKHQNRLFDQKIKFTSKLKDNTALVFSGRLIDEKSPQNYQITQFFYQDLFPAVEEANNVVQQSENHMQYAGINVHLLKRKNSGNLLELQIGNEFRKDRLATSLSLLQDSFVLDEPDDYQNQNMYQVNDLYFKSKYLLDINNVSLTGKLDVHQLLNRLEIRSNTSTQNPFFVNPSLRLDWKINDKNKVVSSYSYNTTNAKIQDVFSDYVLTGFRSFSRGTGSFNQLDATSVVLDYQFGNWTDRFFANTMIIYLKNHDFFSSNTLVNQNFTQSDKILIEDREFISVNSKFDYYLTPISSNLKLDLAYTVSEFKNIVNDSDFREITNTNYHYGIELRSGFQGIFNYHVGTKWITTDIATTTNNSFTDIVSFLDLNFRFNEKFDIQIRSERYFFGNLKTDNVYYFLDFDARYKVIKNKLSIGISGKNLLNTERFRNYSVSDIGTSITEYRLLPRFTLVKLEYRFN